MEQIKTKYILVSCIVCLALAISGCISIPNSPNPRFYALSAINEVQVSKKMNIATDGVIGIGPVKIPEYQNRPQIVTQSQEKLLKFSEFDRWGQSLDLGVASVVREDLTVMLPGAKLVLYPWNPLIAVKYQVVAEIIQLDSQLDGDMFLAVQWTVIDLQNSKTVMIKRSEFRHAILPPNYTGLAKTLSLECASLSSQIAQALVTLK